MYDLVTENVPRETVLGILSNIGFFPGVLPGKKTDVAQYTSEETRIPTTKVRR